MIRYIFLLFICSIVFANNVYVINNFKQIEVDANGDVSIQDAPMLGKKILIKGKWCDISKTNPCPAKVFATKHGGVDVHGRIVKLGSRKVEAVFQVFEDENIVVIFCATSAPRRNSIIGSPFSSTGDLLVLERATGAFHHYTLGPSAPVLAICLNE